MPQCYVRCRASRKFTNATSRRTSNGLELFRIRRFKLVNGRNDAATFLPPSTKCGPCISHNSEHVYPSGENTVKFTHKKASDGIEMNRNYSSEAINGIEKKKIYSPETNDGIEMNKNHSPDEMTKDLMINPYKRVILKEPTKTKDQVPMEEWSILSDHVKYVTHIYMGYLYLYLYIYMDYRQNRNLYRSLNNEQTIKTNLNFGNSPENLKSKYLDVYEEVYAEVINTDKFDEDTDISTTYLGPVDMTRNTQVKAEENFPMTGRGYTRGHLLDSTDCDILIDTGTSKS